MSTKEMDNAALDEMKRMYGAGLTTAFPGPMARHLRKFGFRCDVVCALGAMLRVERRYRRWVNAL
jgi:hypothetical protein